MNEKHHYRFVSHTSVQEDALLKELNDLAEQGYRVIEVIWSRHRKTELVGFDALLEKTTVVYDD